MIDAVGRSGGVDSTTFMGAPPTTAVKSNGPRQCVNGYGACKFISRMITPSSQLPRQDTNSFLFLFCYIMITAYTNWFHDRTLSFNPTNGARKISLAAMVHYKYVEGPTPVLLVVTGDSRKQLFVTYNVQFGHIKDLGEYDRSLTIVSRETRRGYIRTVVQAQVNATQTSATVAGVSFQVCGLVDEDIPEQSPAQMVIGISRDGSGCNGALFTGPLNNPL
jgi:hypothetical protein